MEKNAQPAPRQSAAPRTAPARARGMETENFPVGSRLLPARLRPPVHAFYAVVRAADDIADATDLDPADKHARLDLIEAGLRGRTPGDPRGHALHAALVAAGQTGLERHAIDMLAAFRADIDARPCADWDGLRAYCRSSADPVGRYLLDLHGEAEADREAADALCTALQLLNHGQDLGEDWRDLGRIYLPADWLAEAGAAPDDLGAAALTPGLRAALDRMLDCCETLLARAGALPGTVRSRRLRAEITVIRALALRLLARLRRSDPLATRVAPARGDWLRAGLRGGVVLVAPRRARRTAPGRAA